MSKKVANTEWEALAVVQLRNDGDSMYDGGFKNYLEMYVSLKLSF